MTKGVFSEFEGFNTSHVTLYRKCGSGVVYQPMVSIHLMLLFIRHDLDEKGIAYPFQYISCYSLSGHQAINACLTSAFQYISCYSLSRGFSALPWPQPRFNTSHITLYLTAVNGDRFYTMFQYISCYSLSNIGMGSYQPGNVSIHLMLLFIIVLVCRSPYHIRFQYISCYSLS